MRGLVVLALLAFAAASGAQQAYLGDLALPPSAWAVHAGSGHSSNASRSPGGSGDTIATAGADGAFYDDEGRLTGAFAGAVAYDEYLNGTYAGDLQASASATARYDVVPERFWWTLDDSYGQAASNTFQPITPANRIDVNAFGTGPEFDLPLGRASGLHLGARYARTDYERGTVDDRRTSATLSAYRRLSPLASLSGNFVAQRVEYRADPLRGYDTQELYGRYERRQSRGALTVDAGVTAVHDQGHVDELPLARVTLSRQMARSWRAELALRSEFRNSGDLFRGRLLANGPGEGSPTPVDVTLTDSPARYEEVRGTIGYSGLRTQLSIALALSRERYRSGAAGNTDRSDAQLAVTASRDFGPRLRGSAGAAWVRRHFPGSAVRDEDRDASLQLEWRSSPGLTTSLGYRYEERRSGFGAFGYRAHLVYLRANYGRSRPPATAPGLAPLEDPAPAASPVDALTPESAPVDAVAPGSAPVDAELRPPQ